MSLTSHKLFESEDVCVRYVSCCAEHERPGEVEYSSSETLVLPITGAFSKHLSPSRSFLATPATALFFAAGRPHRVSHPCGKRDECLAIDFDDTIMRTTLIDTAGADRLADSRLQPCAVLPLPALVARTLLMRRHIGTLEAAEIALSLLACTLRLAQVNGPGWHMRCSTVRRHHEMVESVQQTLVSNIVYTPSIIELAKQVNAAPFHMMRIFRGLTGVPIHEYLVRLRLSRALMPLLDGKSIAEIAAGYGFSSHSHFSFVFRRYAGITPSQFRKISASGGRKEVSRIVTALELEPL